MSTKLLNWLGLIACITLVVACFLPWVYYADLNQTFTGFYSYRNEYGKPGKLLVAIGVITFIFMLLPRVWAKRINLFLTALCVGYTIKTYILFTSCYNVYCPQKLYGIYLMIMSSAIMLVAAVFPQMKLKAPDKQ